MNDHPSPEQMADYLGNELPTGMRAEIESHVAECSVCRDRLEELRKTLGVLERLETVSMAEALAATHRLHVVRVAPAWQRFSLTLLKSAAVLALGVYLGRASLGGAAQAPTAPPEASAIAGSTIHPGWIKRARQFGIAGASIAGQVNYPTGTSDW